MSGICGDWTAQEWPAHDWPAHDWPALSSENERLAQAAGDSTGASSPAGTVPARWAELASQRERLIATAPPLSGLASSRAESDLRLVVRAA
jgi:hypothetical protein